jgi:hypothetical protein
MAHLLRTTIRLRQILFVIGERINHLILKTYPKMAHLNWLNLLPLFFLIRPWGKMALFPQTLGEKGALFPTPEKNNDS